jgi:hypothetical protein
MKISRYFLTFVLTAFLATAWGAEERAVAADSTRIAPGQLVQALPGQVVRSLPGQLVAPLSGEIVGSLPGQLVQSLPGQMVQALPDQLATSLPGEVVEFSASQSAGSLPAAAAPWLTGQVARPALGQLASARMPKSLLPTKEAASQRGERSSVAAAAKGASINTRPAPLLAGTTQFVNSTATRLR